MKADRFKDVPRGEGFASRYLYAIEYSDGRVKVGHTYRPRDRMREHDMVVQRRGHRLCRFALVRTEEQSYLNEREMLQRIGRIGRLIPGRLETFEGVRFGQAVNLIRQIGPRQFVELGF